jgi:rubrerythrin
MESRRAAIGSAEAGTDVLPGARRPAAAPTLELACGACGYGIVVRRVPRSCPMCGRRAWEPPSWRPFSRLGRPPDDAA